MKKIIIFIILFFLISISIPTSGIDYNQKEKIYNIEPTWDVFFIDILADVEITDIIDYKEILGGIFYTTNSKIKSDPFKRINFFSGMPLDVTEFDNGGTGYLITRTRIINRAFHGQGIIHGLAVNPTDNSTF
jgi:hypothetical protein